MIMSRRVATAGFEAAAVIIRHVTLPMLKEKAARAR
jgi:hypothetical protein